MTLSKYSSIRPDVDLQSDSEASNTEPSISMASTNTIPTPSVPPSTSSPVLASNLISGSPDEKQRKNKTIAIKVARASSWASLVGEF